MKNSPGGNFEKWFLNARIFNKFFNEGKTKERRFKMEPYEYNDLMEIIEKQDRIIKIQRRTIDLNSRIIEIKDKRIEVQGETISELKKMVELLKK